MDQRWAHLRPGARARRAGLWLARASIAVSLVLVGARYMDISIGLPGARDLPDERPVISGQARPPSVGQDPSLIPPLQLPPRLLPPPPAAMAGPAAQPALVGALVPIPVSEALSGQPAQQPARKLLATVTRHRRSHAAGSRSSPQPPPTAPVTVASPSPAPRPPTGGPPVPSPTPASSPQPPPSPSPPPTASPPPTPSPPPSPVPPRSPAPTATPPSRAGLVSPPH